LEELFTHLQTTVQSLSDEVFVQSRRIDALERQAAALKTQLAAATAALGEERSLEDEKPPHY
jgi:SlyX protein